MDWNVFFSTVSQTSGAIVGIFSAFLITKIISNQADFSRVNERVLQIINKSKSLKLESENRHFEWYGIRVCERALDRLRNMYDETKELLSEEDYYNQLNFSPFQSKSQVLNSIREVISEIRAEEEKRRGNVFYSPLMTASRVPNLELIKATQNERELIDALKIRIHSNINDVESICKEVVNEEYGKKLITISIISSSLLFLLGVIYPLSFLPKVVGEEVNLSFMAFFDVLFSIKGFFLSLLSIVFIGLMSSFLYINMNLKFNKDILITLGEYKTVGAYSKYFENEQNNFITKQ